MVGRKTARLLAEVIPPQTAASGNPLDTVVFLDKRNIEGNLVINTWGEQVF